MAAVWDAGKEKREKMFEKNTKQVNYMIAKILGICTVAILAMVIGSNRVSELCGIINGYSHISVSGDRLAVHEHRHDKEKSITKTQVIEFDEAYFKGKDIYVFDDVVTTGASYAIFANQLEMFGGNVLGGLFLGRTHYKYAK